MVDHFFLALGIAAIYLESELEVANGFRAAAASILWGVEEIVNHRAFYSFSWQKKERDLTLKTTASIAVSLLRLLIAIGLITIALLGYLGLDVPAADFIKTRPGLVMVFFSSLCLTCGAQQFLMSRKQGKSLKVVLENFSGRIFAIILVLVSSIVFLLGITEILWPEVFQSYLCLFLSQLNFPFYPG